MSRPFRRRGIRARAFTAVACALALGGAAGATAERSPDAARVSSEHGQRELAAAGAAARNAQPVPGLGLGAMNAYERTRIEADEVTINRETAIERRLSAQIAADQQEALGATKKIAAAETREKRASRLASLYLADAKRIVAETKKNSKKKRLTKALARRDKRESKLALACEQAETTEVVKATMDDAAADSAAAQQATIVAAEDRASALKYQVAEAAAAAEQDMAAVRSEASLAQAAAREAASLQASASKEQAVAASENAAAAATVRRAAGVLAAFRKEVAEQAKKEAEAAAAHRRHRR